MSLPIFSASEHAVPVVQTAGVRRGLSNRMIRCWSEWRESVDVEQIGIERLLG